MVEHQITLPHLSVSELCGSFEDSWLQPLQERGDAHPGSRPHANDSHLDLDVGTPACDQLRERYARASGTAAVPTVSDSALSGSTGFGAVAESVERALLFWRMRLLRDRHFDSDWEAQQVRRIAAVYDATKAAQGLRVPLPGADASASVLMIPRSRDVVRAVSGGNAAEAAAQVLTQVDECARAEVAQWTDGGDAQLHRRVQSFLSRADPVSQMRFVPDWIAVPKDIYLDPLNLADPLLQEALAQVPLAQAVVDSLAAGLEGTAVHFARRRAMEASALFGADYRKDAVVAKNAQKHDAAAALPISMPPVASSDVILRVAIYSSCVQRRERELLLSASRNTLADLRDHIVCLRDEIAELIYSDDRKLKSDDPSFFFVEGVCYDDFRMSQSNKEAPSSASSASAAAPHCACHAHKDKASHQEVRLSDMVLEWANTSYARGISTGWPPLQSGCMQHTRLADLQLRLGAHYLFRHRGSCEHIVVVQDAFVATSAAMPLSASPVAYPQLVYAAPLRRSLCDACGVLAATKMAVGDLLADTTPAYFCDHCFDALHCDEKGNLLRTDMHVLPYLHDP
jgi:hypothetical protein